MHRWPLSLLLLPLVLSAAPPSPEPTPVTIEADRMELDQRLGTSRYLGHVILLQGKLQIHADSITLYSAEGGLIRAQVEGNPATLKQEGDGTQTLRAEAMQMEYMPHQQVVELKGKAKLSQGGNEFSGEQISYDLGQQLVRASGVPAEDGDKSRVRVLLQPMEQETTPEEKP